MRIGVLVAVRAPDQLILACLSIGVEIGIEEGLPSYLINDGSELKPEWVKGKKVVGLTAGASAPEELVRHVIEALERIEPVTVETMDGKKEHIEFRLPAELRA